MVVWPLQTIYYDSNLTQYFVSYASLELRRSDLVFHRTSSGQQCRDGITLLCLVLKLDKSMNFRIGCSGAVIRILSKLYIFGNVFFKCYLLTFLFRNVLCFI